MKNLTVSLDEETYRRARAKAAAQGASVSALVRRYLTELASTETDFERLKHEERALRESIALFRAEDRLPREEVHSRPGN